MTNQQFSKAKSISIKHAFSEKGFVIMAAMAYLALVALPAFINSGSSLKSEVEAVTAQNQQEPQSPTPSPMVSQDTVSSDLEGSSSQAPNDGVTADSNSSSSVSIRSSVTTTGGSSKQSVVTTETVNGETEETVVKSEKEGNSTVKFNVSVDPDSESKMKVTERNGRVKVDYRSRSE